MPAFNKWESFARSLIELRYPPSKFRTRAGQPRCDGLVADFGIFVLDPGARNHVGDLVCIVEVGALSSPHKLVKWEEKFPGVEIWWLPKSDILRYVFPETAKYRYPLPDTNLGELATEIVSLHVEARRLHGALYSIDRRFRESLVKFKRLLATLREGLEDFASSYEEIVESVSGPGDSVMANFDRIRSLYEASHEGEGIHAESGLDEVATARGVGEKS